MGLPPLAVRRQQLILGYNLVLFDVLRRRYSMAAGFAHRGRWLRGLRRSFSLERGVLAGLLLLAAGAAIELEVVVDWVRSGYGALMAVRQIVVGMALMVLGVQTVFASFLVSLMEVERQPLAAQTGVPPDVLRADRHSRTDLPPF